MATPGGDRRRELEDELAAIDAERDEALFGLRLERRTPAVGDEGPSSLRLRYEELETRRAEVKAELKALNRP